MEKQMKRVEFEKIVSACELDLQELKNEGWRDLYKIFGENHFDINYSLVNRIRKNINSRLLRLERGENYE